MGPQGQQGALGPTGPAGSNGNPGQQGPAGKSALQYLKLEFSCCHRINRIVWRKVSVLLRLIMLGFRWFSNFKNPQIFTSYFIYYIYHIR